MLAASLAPSDEKAATAEFLEVFGRLKKATGAATDTELAKILGIKQGAVSSAKRNLQIPPIWIAKVSRAFSVSADWLFYGTGPMKRGNAQPTAPGPGKINPIPEGEPQWMSPEAAPKMGYSLIPKVRA
ncbi:MAG: helix-turn-helix domain-containing protein, partial [Desulfovibrionaceae bacterium]